MNRISPILLFLLFSAGLMGVFSGCGKKGPPFLPEKTFAASVDRLTATWVDGTIRLEGAIEGADKGFDLAGCTIYHAWYPEDHPPCEGCPIEMAAFDGAAETTLSGDRFACDIPVKETSGIWFLEVRLTDTRGAVGPSSERIRLKVKK